ncbi:MAG: hypothetical protein JKY86_07615 [Gammaproteobacteria bacterium]|nr:hypothetical protein [Gammaproteobacteria bacterium]
MSKKEQSFNLSVEIAANERETRLPLGRGIAGEKSSRLVVPDRIDQLDFVSWREAPIEFYVDGGFVGEVVLDKGNNNMRTANESLDMYNIIKASAAETEFKLIVTGRIEANISAETQAEAFRWFFDDSVGLFEAGRSWKIFDNQGFELARGIGIPPNPTLEFCHTGG